MCEILGKMEPDYISGITLLGGESMVPINQPHVLKVLRRVRKELPEKSPSDSINSLSEGFFNLVEAILN